MPDASSGVGLQYEPVSVAVEGVGLRLACLIRPGPLPPVLSLHGFGSTKEDHADFALHRHSRGRMTAAFDEEDPMPKLYSMAASGNCYKAELTAALLDVPLQIVRVNILDGETRTPEYRKRNPNGKVPLLELDDGRYLPESNAIIYYLANGSALIPEDPFTHAQMLHWMFFEQHSHEPYIAEARFWRSIKPGGREEKAAYFPAWHEKGHGALKIMEEHLQNREWFAGTAQSLADIALYAYTHVAEEGGFDMSGYPSVRSWLARVTDQPAHIPMRVDAY